MTQVVVQLFRDQVDRYNCIEPLSADAYPRIYSAAIKHERDVTDVLERWSEQEYALRAHADNYKLNAAFKVTALCVLMTCKRE